MTHVKTPQCGKFVLRNQNIGHAILMLYVYLLLNFKITVCSFQIFQSELRNMPCLMLLGKVKDVAWKQWRININHNDVDMNDEVYALIHS